MFTKSYKVLGDPGILDKSLPYRFPWLLYEVTKERQYCYHRLRVATRKENSRDVVQKLVICYPAVASTGDSERCRDRRGKCVLLPASTSKHHHGNSVCMPSDSTLSDVERLRYGLHPRTTTCFSCYLWHVLFAPFRSADGPDDNDEEEDSQFVTEVETGEINFAIQAGLINEG